MLKEHHIEPDSASEAADMMALALARLCDRAAEIAQLNERIAALEQANRQLGEQTMAESSLRQTERFQAQALVAEKVEQISTLRSAVEKGNEAISRLRMRIITLREERVVSTQRIKILDEQRQILVWGSRQEREDLLAALRSVGGKHVPAEWFDLPSSDPIDNRSERDIISDKP